MSPTDGTVVGDKMSSASLRSAKSVRSPILVSRTSRLYIFLRTVSGRACSDAATILRFDVEVVLSWSLDFSTLPIWFQYNESPNCPPVFDRKPGVQSSYSRKPPFL